MKKTLLFTFILSLVFNLNAQDKTWADALKNKTTTLNVYYGDFAPFSFVDKKTGLISGIEADIIKEFVSWAKVKKGVVVNVKYTAKPVFQDLYNDVKQGQPNTLGVGSVTINTEREKDIAFTAAYMKNMSVLITHGGVPTLKKMEDISTVFDSLTAVTEKGTSHEKYLSEIKQKYFPTMKITMEQPDIAEKIAKNKKTFGYVDLIVFWNYVTKNSGYLKMHRIANMQNEEFGFILPKGSDWKAAFDEFLEGGFGFTATKKYKAILEKYLGYEVIQSVEFE